MGLFKLEASASNVFKKSDAETSFVLNVFSLGGCGCWSSRPMSSPGRVDVRVCKG